MKKFLLATCILALALFMVTACSNDEPDETTPSADIPPVTGDAPPEVAAVEAPPEVAADWQLNDGNPATISFEWWGGDSRHTAILNAIEIFETRYAHITVEPRFDAFAGYLDRLSMNLIAGTEPDVVQSNFAWVHALGGGYNVFADHLMPSITQYLDLTEWSSDLRAFTTTRDGQLSGIPHGVTGRVVIYNTEMFPDGFPATWDELIEVGTEIGAGNATVDAGENRYAFFPVGYQSWDIIVMTMVLNEYGINLQADGQILPSVDQVESALLTIERAIEAGVLPTFIQQEAPLDTTNPVWMQGRGGGLFEWVSNIFLAAGNFEGTDLDARQVDGVGVALLPAMSAGTTQNSMQRPSLVHAVTNAAVERGVEHIAAYFLNFIYTDEEALLAIGDQFGIPLARSAAEIADREGQVWGLMAEGLELLVANVGDMCHLFEDPELRPARRAAFEAFHSGAISAREAAERWVNDQQSYLNAR